MGRHGSFGARPRIAQSLTSIIVSEERAMQSRRDQNIIDAWKNGGLFEGKKPTDESVLAYFGKRESNLDKKDPLYDTMHDEVMQLQYGIAQSKAELANKQGKLSDAGYANFFLNWSKKVPKNSEFYRTLQKDAASLIERTKTDAANKVRKAKADAFDAFAKSTSDSKINVGSALLDAINEVAKESGLNLDADGEQIVGLLNDEMKANPQRFKVLTDAMRKADPNAGPITPGYVAKAMQNATDGYTALADRANKDGYPPQYQAYAKAAGNMAGAAGSIKAWPVEQSYDTAYQTLIKVWQDPTSSEIDRNEAARIFATATGKLGNTPGIDPILKQRLQADSDRALGKPAGDTVSLAAVLGRKPLDDSTATKIKTSADKQALKDANPGAYVYAPVDANGQYDPTGKGGLGIVPTGNVQGDVAQVVVVGTSGKPVVATVPAHPIYAVNPQNPKDKQIVGHYVSYNNGQKPETQVSYSGKDGQTRWTNLDSGSPWDTHVTSQIDGDGNMFLTSPAPSQGSILEQAQQIDKLKGTHLASLLTGGAPLGSSVGLDKTVVTGDVSESFIENGAKVTVSLKDGKFEATRTESKGEGANKVDTTQAYDLSTLAGATGQAGFALWKPSDVLASSRAIVGDIPGVTYKTPLAASTDSAGGAQSGVTSAVANDPAYQQAFLTQAMNATGATSPTDPKVLDQWKAITTPTLGPPAPNATTRGDLAYPGQKPDTSAANGGSATINFGGQSIKIPHLPSYLGQSTVDASGAAPLVAAGQTAIDLFKTALGLPPSVLPEKPQQPAGAAAPVIPPPTMPANVGAGLPKPSATPTPLGADTPVGVTSKQRAL